MVSFDKAPDCHQCYHFSSLSISVCSFKVSLFFPEPKLPPQRNPTTSLKDEAKTPSKTISTSRFAVGTSFTRSIHRAPKKPAKMTKPANSLLKAFHSISALKNLSFTSGAMDFSFNKVG